MVKRFRFSRVALVSVVLVVLGTLGSLVHAANDGSRNEVTSIISAFEDTWNRHDMKALGTLFAEDADFVNVLGMRWIGRNAITEAHEATHSTIFKTSHLHIEETSVRFLKPDVAVARSRWALEGHTSPSGEAQPQRHGILTNVVVKSKGVWQIVVTQNTDIVSPRP